MDKDHAAKIITMDKAREQVYDVVKEREENVIGSRLQKARMEKDLTLTALSKLLSRHGVTVHRQGISKWENGGSVPNAYQLIAVCHALGIDDGIEYFSGTPRAEELDATGRRKLEEYKSDLIATGRYRPAAPDTDATEYIEMPVSTLRASAGTGAFLDEGNYDLVSFPADSVPANADFALKVSGDSMEPVYHDGQLVWVQQCEALRSGEVGVFICDGEGYIKVYGEREPEDAEAFTDSEGVIHMQPVLISYNENYAPRPISAASVFRVVGRILG